MRKVFVILILIGSVSAVNAQDESVRLGLVQQQATHGALTLRVTSGISSHDVVPACEISTEVIYAVFTLS